MAEQFVLIPGRSSRQGVTLNEGKYTDGYRDETSTLRMNPQDMQRLGLTNGDEVRMWNDVGEVVVPCIDAKDECPEGLIFICYGDKSSQLMGGETHGSGMPDSKGLDVFVLPAAVPKSTAMTPQVATSSVQPAAARTGGASTPEASRDHQAVPAQGAESHDHHDDHHAPGKETNPVFVLGLFAVVVLLIAILMKVLS